MFKHIHTGWLALIATMMLLAGCNTVEGAGEDIESVGDGIEDAADDDTDI
ncbi:MAG: entericidin A/B family lipoprotein [Rhodothalassiaceae bacterium]